MNKFKGLLSTDCDGIDILVELALDISWSWDHAADEIWEELAPKLWELTRNPWVVLQTISKDQIEGLLSDKVFRNKIEKMVKSRREISKQPAWFQNQHEKSPLKCIAYFCMEYMLSEALPIYSGGLGNVAGDQLKAATDLGVPVVAIGLLYQQGYFRQVLDSEGRQLAVFPFNDSRQLPIMPVREENGDWLRLQMQLPSGEIVWLRAWQVQVGRLRLYLLDCNDSANPPKYREITNELYGGGSRRRLLQELVLGIGGYRLLNKLGIEPDVCHLNEGHAAFAILERAHMFMEKTGQSFEVALSVTRAGNLFTTHTPVAAGFDRFSQKDMDKYLREYSEKALGISFQELMGLGRENPNDETEGFNMAYLAIRGSNSINGVSDLHGRVSRHLFSSLFPRWPIHEIPVGHVTNGVHTPTWASTRANYLWTETCGKSHWLEMVENLEANIRALSDQTLWDFRNNNREYLIGHVRERLSRQVRFSSGLVNSNESVKKLFNPNVLTIGFGRRFATYKRGTMLLHDKNRLKKLLTNPQMPVQLIIAGKAHPEDLAGQALIHEWTSFIRDTEEIQSHVVFLEDYDMRMTQELVHGIDVWLNTPRRPWEASGTSGMKVLVNGGLNLSELDGWWAEAYSPKVGWALGDGQEHRDVSEWDIAEAEALYLLLENEVIPEFYTRNKKGIPVAWVKKMRESMASLTPQFSSARTVVEYTEDHYVPAALSYHARSSNNGALGIQIHNWLNSIDRNWPKLKFSDYKVTSNKTHNLFEVEVYLHELDPSSVRVELFANGIAGSHPEIIEMKNVSKVTESLGSYLYSASVPLSHNQNDCTPRIIPSHSDILVPLESNHILWQR